MVQSAGEIRAARPSDISALTALRNLSFRHSAHSSVGALEQYLNAVFFENPWRPDVHPSWVIEGDDKIIGFLGSFTRQLEFEGQPLSMGVLSHFMVHPDARGRGVGRRLMQHFLNGPLDIYWSDVANEATRAVWKASGGAESRLHSLYRQRPLRPVRQGAAQAVSGAVGRGALRIARPLVEAVDSLIVHAATGPHRLPKPTGRVESLNPSDLARLVGELIPQSAVRATYDADMLAWILGHVKRKNAGTLEQSMVVDGDSPIGWFIWFVNPRGMSRVVQFGAKPETAATTFGHSATTRLGARSGQP